MSSLRPALQEAGNLIDGDREEDYGEASKSFGRIAALWAAYWGHEVTRQDVAALMALMKLSRIAGDPTKRDSWIDGIGYLALGADMSSDMSLT